MACAVCLAMFLLKYLGYCVFILGILTMVDAKYCLQVSLCLLYVLYIYIYMCVCVCVCFQGIFSYFQCMCT